MSKTTDSKSHSCRVLSIQSHVVRGYVGNKSATFPLQLLGYEVDALNSVQFSVHTFYKYWKGQILNSEQLWEVYEGLRLNNLHVKYSHLLTGYCRDPTFLRRIVEIITDLRSVNPNLYYICDPVLGDRGHYYVPEELMAIYRDVIMPLANVITPNQFELQELSGVTIDSESSALSAMDVLHKRGNRTIVITSTDLAPNPDQMFVYGSRMTNEKDKPNRFRFTIDRLDATFVGTGDLFASLLLAWMQRTDNDLCVSVRNVLNSLQAILRRTLAAAEQEMAGTGSKPGPAELELRLVQNQDCIKEPELLDFVKEPEFL